MEIKTNLEALIESNEKKFTSEKASFEERINQILLEKERETKKLENGK